MHTPTAALAWELWRRHRQRVLAIVGIVLAFILVYPKLCALAGFNLDSPDALAEMGTKILSLHRDGALRIIQTLYLMFLVFGPTVAMLLTLLCVIWMFTFTEFDPNTKEAMKFPVRLFTLPVSTPFLFWRFLLGGLAAVVVLYASWVYCVRQPHVELFTVYQNCFGWMTLLVVAQGLVWALAAWPNARILASVAVLYGFLGSPARRDIFESPFVLPPLFLLGMVLARAGLQKMRHGQWQGWNWQWPFPALAARAGLRGPKQFASPAQAQLWFEWRRVARGMCFLFAALALGPVVIGVLVRVAAGLGPINQNDLSGFSVLLVLLTLLIPFCVWASPQRADLSFAMVRPLTSGGMVLPMLKAAAIGAVLSWLAVLAALSALPLLGNFGAVEESISPFPGVRAALVLGLVFLTWRAAAANLCFALPGSRWSASVPALLVLAFAAGILALFYMQQNDVYWDSFLRLVPILLLCLVAVKFLLAFLSFGVSLRRHLLTPRDVVHYLAAWILLAAALLGAMALARPGKELIFPLSLGVVLLVPLARIGFCPIALARGRHT